MPCSFDRCCHSFWETLRGQHRSTESTNKQFTSFFSLALRLDSCGNYQKLQGISIPSASQLVRLRLPEVAAIVMGRCPAFALRVLTFVTMMRSLSCAFIFIRFDCSANGTVSIIRRSGRGGTTWQTALELPPLGRTMFQRVRIAGRVLLGSLLKIHSSDSPYFLYANKCCSSSFDRQFCLLVLKRSCSSSLKHPLSSLLDSGSLSFKVLSSLLLYDSLLRNARALESTALISRGRVRVASKCSRPASATVDRVALLNEHRMVYTGCSQS